MYHLMEGKKCYLRTLREEDAIRMAFLVGRNRHYWSEFEPRHEDAYYTVETQRERIREILIETSKGREFNFGIFDAKTSELIGNISMYGVKRHPFLSAFVGYSIDKDWAGFGYGTEAVRLVTSFGWKKLRLHRIEAYVSPRNIGSIKVLEKAGFTREGLLRELLFINGKWEDHYMYGMLEHDVKRR
ncbi:GNAT family N-acetyltransferase [Paenisporosarcina cavernae]|uniref:N-acetyltransferase n=1 Tax=Paenisporosarcina cavernae TaxID=2320858 RepID=A0A385YU99_9BACL|nr:GNAT family protein [Paenisporosarcina cavernae]AYC30256.1 N-acetyltransferase [Paenisporosarcina cavernae]